MAILKNTSVNNASGIVELPDGSGTQRPATPNSGMARYNSSRQELEIYNNTSWADFENINTNEFATNKVLDIDGDKSSYPGNGIIVPDISGSNQNGTLVNSPSHSTDYSGYFNFNGTDQYVSNTTFNIGTDPIFTISMWIRRTDTLSNQGYWGLGGDGSINRGICGYTSPNRPNKIAWDLWGQTTFDINADYPLNEWIHVAWVKTGAGFTLNTLKIYVNGAECPLTITARNNSSTVNIVTGYAIGRISPTVNQYYAPGDVTNIQIFNKALTNLEVSQHYVSQAKRFNSSTVGSSPETPAESAEQIRQNHPNPPNGFYWIRQIESTAYRHYCVFKRQDGNNIQGGPWTVAFKAGVAPNSFSNNGPAAMNTFRAQCRTVGIDTPGRGMETFRGATDANGGWLAVKRAIHEGYPNFVDGKSSGGGGVLAMPMMNINGEGGTSDHRTVYEPQYRAQISPNFTGDACNANQLFCGWWGAQDISSWTTDSDGIPGPEDWAPANAANTTYGGDGLAPQLLACVYK